MVKKQEVELKRTTVESHKSCVELTSGKFTLAVTTKVGPRIIGGFVNKSKNIFRVMPPEDLPGCTTGFKLYGGHRLWHAPEAMPRTYAPDNEPVAVSETADGIEFSSGVEALTGLEKSITIDSLGNERFRVTHRLINRNQWQIQIAPWALSVMAQGGMAIIPQQHSKKADPFAVDRSLNVWPYTDLRDPRLTIGSDYIFLRQDPTITRACKIGFNAEDGWVAYLNAGVALVKYFEHFVDAAYPDNGCSVESYACADFCEIETVAPLYDLEPGETAEHVELWQGLYGLPAITTEEEVREHLGPAVA